MIDVLLHYRGQGVAERSLPCVPHVGTYIMDACGLWSVASVVISDGTIHVYASKAAEGWAATLAAEWATWCQPTTEGATNAN